MRLALFAIFALVLPQVSVAWPLRLLLEPNSDAPAGSEVFATSFATFDDFLNSPSGPPGSFSGIGISQNFDVVGFAYDGMYRLLLETNTDSAAGSEVFVASFATFDDFLNSPPAPPGSFSGIGISQNFDVVGFAYDGMYRLLLETNIDSAAGSEVFAVSYATFDDFLNSPSGPPGSFSGIGISQNFDVVGFANEFQVANTVPEPSVLNLLGLVLAGFCFMRRWGIGGHYRLSPR